MKTEINYFDIKNAITVDTINGFLDVNILLFLFYSSIKSKILRLLIFLSLKNNINTNMALLAPCIRRYMDGRYVKT
jgi:hypothetical protein